MSSDARLRDEGASGLEQELERSGAKMRQDARASSSVRDAARLRSRTANPPPMSSVVSGSPLERVA